MNNFDYDAKRNMIRMFGAIEKWSYSTVSQFGCHFQGVKKKQRLKKKDEYYGSSDHMPVAIGNYHQTISN